MKDLKNIFDRLLLWSNQHSEIACVSRGSFNEIILTGMWVAQERVEFVLHYAFQKRLGQIADSLAEFLTAEEKLFRSSDEPAIGNLSTSHNNFDRSVFGAHQKIQDCVVNRRDHDGLVLVFVERAEQHDEALCLGDYGRQFFIVESADLGVVTFVNLGSGGTRLIGIFTDEESLKDCYIVFTPTFTS